MYEYLKENGWEDKGRQGVEGHIHLFTRKSFWSDKVNNKLEVELEVMGQGVSIRIIREGKVFDREWVTQIFHGEIMDNSELEMLFKQLQIIPR